MLLLRFAVQMQLLQQATILRHLHASLQLVITITYSSVPTRYTLRYGHGVPRLHGHKIGQESKDKSSGTQQVYTSSLVFVLTRIAQSLEALAPAALGWPQLVDVLGIPRPQHDDVMSRLRWNERGQRTPQKP